MGFGPRHSNNSGYPLTYKEAVAAIKRAKRDYATVSSNVRLFPVFGEPGAQPNYVSVVLHETEIAKLHADGSVQLYTDGWRTQTTLRWLDEVLGANFAKSVLWNNRGHLTLFKRVETTTPGDWENGIETVHTGEKETRVDFVEGIRIGPRGGITKPPAKDRKREEAKVKRAEELAEKIKAYAEGFTKAFFRGKVSRPGPGDCMYCQMRVTAFETRKVSADTSHLIAHIAERYYVPTLLVNALNHAGWDVHNRPTIMSMALQTAWYEQTGAIMMADMVADNMYIALVKYLSHHLKAVCNVRSTGNGARFLPEKDDHMPAQVDDNGPLFGD